MRAVPRRPPDELASGAPDLTGPRVTAVFARGRLWSDKFLAHFGGRSRLGSAAGRSEHGKRNKRGKRDTADETGP